MRFKKSPSLLEGVKGTMEGHRLLQTPPLFTSQRSVGKLDATSSTDLVPSHSPSFHDEREVHARAWYLPVILSAPISTGKVYGCFEKHSFGPDKVSR